MFAISSAKGKKQKHTHTNNQYKRSYLNAHVSTANRMRIHRNTQFVVCGISKRRFCSNVARNRM